MHLFCAKANLLFYRKDKQLKKKNSTLTQLSTCTKEKRKGQTARKEKKNPTLTQLSICTKKKEKTNSEKGKPNIDRVVNMKNA